MAKSSTNEHRDLPPEATAMEQSIGNKMSDFVVEFNAGGKILASKWSTLTIAGEGCLFSRIFNGEWDDRDSNGRIFLDFNSELVETIVDFLRMKRIEDPSHPVEPPDVPPSKKEDFHRLLRYFGLFDYFFRADPDIPISVRSLDIPNIEIFQPNDTHNRASVDKNDDSIEISCNIKNEYFVCCLPSLDSSGHGCFWKVTIEIAWVFFIGIIGNLYPTTNTSEADSTCYGWSRCGDIISRGNRRSEDSSGWTGFDEGECLYFRLQSNTLTMFSVQKNRKFTINGIADAVSKECYIYFGFQNAMAVRLEALKYEEAAVFFFAE